MRWEAANVGPPSSQRTEAASSSRKSSETVEAALARLTKAYSIAMSCLGAMHKLDATSVKEGRGEDLKIQSQKLALAARAAFEKAVLLDPLIAKFCPTWTRVVNGLAERQNEGLKWAFVREQRPAPAVLTSSSHKSTVREIAYLSLLNYADLLVASQQRNHHEGLGLLDRGVVKPFPLVGWEDNIDPELALVSLCDASDLDGSDPVVWLKLACAARKCSIVLGGNPLRYRRLERHALEMGMTALPPTVPPNRSIIRALREHDDLPAAYHDNMENKQEPPNTLVLDLPRYSWSVLGRMLIRACREGAKPDSAESFGSACVELHLSPMLSLPQRSLGLICRYLRNEDIWRFEATCRGLSAAILSARALLERAETTQKVAQEKIQVGPNEAAEASMIPRPQQEHLKKQNLTESRRDEPTRARSSKRVLSQLITSGKRAERESKRASVKYCLLASTLHCTFGDEMHLQMSNGGISWEVFNESTQGTLKGSQEQFLAQSEDSLIDGRLGDSCLTTFINKWSGNNSGPFDILQRYVVHVALNVVQVFQSDQDSLALSGFIIDCVDLVARKGGVSQDLDLCSFGKVNLGQGGEMACLEYFAVNLLNAELRLKRSDGQLNGCGDYESDSNFVAVVVPVLLHRATEIESAHSRLKESSIWVSMKIRSHWLAAGFYLDKSRLSQNICESRTAEDFGIKQVESTIHCLSLPAGSPVLSVKTPHLMSPRRTGPHWKVLSFSSLAAFRDDIQASSVVSGARQQFLDHLTEIETHWQSSPDKTLRVEDIAGLVGVGETLAKRYNGTYQEEGVKYDELLEDFIASCEDELSHHLTATVDKGREETRWGVLWFLISSTASSIEHIIEIPNPSILTILTTCIMSSNDGSLPVTELITRLAIGSFRLLGTGRKGIRVSRNLPEDEFDDLMSDDEMLSDGEHDAKKGGSQQRGGVSGKRGSDQRRDSLVAVAAELFVDKLVYLFQHQLSEEERRIFATSGDCLAMIEASMTSVSNWYERRDFGRSTSSAGSHDLRTFLGMCSLQVAISRMNPVVLDAEVAFFVGYYRILVCQRQLLPTILGSGNDNRSGRSAKQKEFLGRAELIGAVLSNVAVLLSRYPSRTKGWVLLRSTLIGKAFSEEEEPGHCVGPQTLFVLIEALLYLWNIVGTEDIAHSGSILGRICSETLLVPVAAAIVSLCGSALCSLSSRPSFHSSTTDALSLNEFFDSDASANECDTDTSANSIRKIDLLQPLCQAVHCIALVVDTVDEKGAWRYTTQHLDSKEKDSFFPLIATRVLSFLADLLLTQFGDKATAEENLWQKSFPYGTRTVGTFLDSILHKVYKQLYGFTIQGYWIEREKLSDDKCKSLRGPESTKASAQLYRCIQRAYTLSRKSVPKAALECVNMALPEAEDCPRRKALRNFMFDTETKAFSSLTISLLAGNNDSWNEPFRAYHQAALQLCSEAPDEDFKDEVRMMRKGIAKEFSHAPLPNISHSGVDGTKGGKSDDFQKTSEERALASFQERELSKKFWAIVDNMSYGDPADYDGWLRAAECLTVKAELIADRLGSSKGFARACDFSIPISSERRPNKLRPLNDLKEYQEREFKTNTMNWVPFLGDDISIYVDYEWSSFPSLENCAKASRIKFKGAAKHDRDKESQVVEARFWNEIEMMHENNDFISWQQAWGGMFVEALRTIAMRCLCMGFFLVGEKANNLTLKDSTSLQSEILETLGIAKYTEMMGSQGFGYPMRTLSDFKKREIAEAAGNCFRNAAKKVEGNHDQFTFDVLLMVGKCYEKSAKTYAAETFPNDASDDTAPPRTYERKMATALGMYQKSLEEAIALDEEGALPDAQAGGSSHGKTEIIYRLHASRLKCLIAAMQYHESVREKAIAEAVRLTNRYWYNDSDSSTINEHTNTYTAVWLILADVVTAMAQCRLEHQFFHRSVYRYAQALMWAPALHDPATGFTHGSLGLVPAIKSHLLRGLNSSTPCANSAEVILSALFEKKRPQLVSVWVTNSSSSPSPLEVINNSTRKFDSLRGKYFKAYVETLTLCKRVGTLEALFHQVVSTKRDLPTFYQASALVRGAIPETSHVKENLIRSDRSSHTHGLVRDLKRITNRALAVILIKESHGLDPKNEYIKKCYTCYLRLNTTVEELEKIRSWQYSGTTLPEVEVLCQAYQSRLDIKEINFNASHWAGASRKVEVLKAALELCSELFPSLATTLYRKSKPKKAPANQAEVEGSQDGPESKKRSTPDNESQVHFVVDVPTGLEVGDKFETTVRIGSQMKTLRLTVPVGLPPKLKFSLDIPDDDGGESSRKRLRET